MCVEVTILSGSTILCKRGELNLPLYKIKPPLTSATVSPPILIFFFNLDGIAKKLSLLKLILFGDSCSGKIINITHFLPKDGLGTMPFHEYTNLRALHLTFFIWNFRSKFVVSALS